MGLKSFVMYLRTQEFNDNWGQLMFFFFLAIVKFARFGGTALIFIIDFSSLEKVIVA